MSLQIPLNLSQTNGHYTFTVPAHGYQSTVDIDIAGAGGGAGGSWYYGAGGHGGNGARIQGSLTVSPGDVIDVYLGAGGKRGGSVGSNYNAGGAGGYGAQIGNMNTGGQTRVWPVTLSYAWSQFMNDNAVWVNSDGVSPVNSKVTVIRYITITQAGWYNFIAAADNDMIVYLNGTQLYEVAGFTGQHGNASSNQYLPAGTHTLRMEVTNWGGPAGFAIEVWHPNAYVVWTTRSVLDPSAFSYDFYGGDGGSTQGDGGYVYPAAGGGGGASAVFVNGNLVLVAGGGGGGGAEGGHGAGGGPGYDAGSNGGGSPLGNRGETGSPGYDIGGTPGGGGGYNGGSQGTFVYYDDAPSNGAKGGTNYNSLNLTYSEGSGVYTVPKGVKQITVTLVGGGGGGAGCSGNEEPVYTGGGGGGGYSTYAVLDVTPGQQIPWTVGTGGYGGSVGNYGSAGSATTPQNPKTPIAAIKLIKEVTGFALAVPRSSADCATLAVPFPRGMQVSSAPLRTPPSLCSGRRRELPSLARALSQNSRAKELQPLVRR